MAVLEMKGREPHGIPAGSHCRVVSMPEQVVVWEGEASGSVALDLPRGIYCLSVVKFPPRSNRGICYQETYQHGATDAQVRGLEGLEPRHIRTTYTSQGVRFKCLVAGCENETKSMFDAKLHMGQHFGTDLLEANAARIDAIAAQVEQTAPRVRNASPAPEAGIPVPSVAPKKAAPFAPSIVKAG